MNNFVYFLDENGYGLFYQFFNDLVFLLVVATLSVTIIFLLLKAIAYYRLAKNTNLEYKWLSFIPVFNNGIVSKLVFNTYAIGICSAIILFLWFYSDFVYIMFVYFIYLYIQFFLLFKKYSNDYIIFTILTVLLGPICGYIIIIFCSKKWGLSNSNQNINYNNNYGMYYQNNQLMGQQYYNQVNSYEQMNNAQNQQNSYIPTPVYNYDNNNVNDNINNNI